MNKRIMRITAIMIIILVIILVLIFAKYLAKSESYNTIKKPYSSNASGEGDKPVTPSNIDNSGEISGTTVDEPENINNNSDEITKEQSNINLKEENKSDVENDNIEKVDKVENEQKDNYQGNKEGIDLNNETNSSSGDNNLFNQNIIVEIGDNKQEPVISSNSETSNQEKQQVLNEIDDALQGLLEAVSKVPVVDENKLDASLESEVQP